MEMRKCCCCNMSVFSGFCNSQVTLFLSVCYRIFLSLMEAAGLTDLLKQEGDFTLFAPSDKAFASLSERDLTLLKCRSPTFPFVF